MFRDRFGHARKRGATEERGRDAYHRPSPPLFSGRGAISSMNLSMSSDVIATSKSPRGFFSSENETFPMVATCLLSVKLTVLSEMPRLMTDRAADLILCFLRSSAKN